MYGYITLSVFNTTTAVEFAGQHFNVLPNTLKLTISVRNWNFRTIRNKLGLVFGASAVGDELISECDGASTTNDSYGNLRAIEVKLYQENTNFLTKPKIWKIYTRVKIVKNKLCDTFFDFL